jgi:hypothetical protein
MNPDISKGELLCAIDKVYRGGYYFGPGYNEDEIKTISIRLPAKSS